MKKLYLTILFLALSFIGFAQQRGNLFVVPHWTTNFTMSLPAHSLVQCTDSGKIYRLLVIGQPTKNLSNTANVVYPTSVGHADSSNVSGFAWLVDSMHIYYYWNVDSLLFDNAYGGNIHCDSIWATTHYAVSAFDTTQSVDTINANIMYLNTFVLNPLLSTSDSIAVFSNDTLRYRLAGGISVLYADSSYVSWRSDTSFLSGIADSSIASAFADSSGVSGIADSSLYSYNSALLQGLDTTAIISHISGINFWKLTGNKLEPKVSTNHVYGDTLTVRARTTLNGKFEYTNGSFGAIIDTNYLGFKLNTWWYGTHPLTMMSSGGSNFSQTYSKLGSNQNFESYFRNKRSDYDTTNGLGLSIDGNQLETSIKDSTGTSYYHNEVNTTNKSCYMSSIQEYTHNSEFWLAGDTITTYINNVNKIVTYDDRTEFYDNVVIDSSLTVNSNATFHGTITNGGLINKDTLLVLEDSTTSLKLPDSTTGWAEIYIDSIGHMVSFANMYWSKDGTVHLISNGANISTSNIDNKHTIVYLGSGVEIRNRRPSKYNYSIKYHYHY